MKAKDFLKENYSGFFDEFDKQELKDIITAMEDYHNSHWVSVDNSLPDEGRYLVKVRRPHQMSVSVELANRYIHKPAVERANTDKNFLISGVVTHWIDIPKM